VLTALAMVFSTCLAMLMASVSVEEGFAWWTPCLHVSMVALPIFAALLTIFRNNFQITQKWAEAHIAASRVVSEIYYFLGNVGPYRAGPAVCQRRFLRRLRSMAKRSSAPWMREEDLAGGWEKVFRDEPERLHQHVRTSLYRSRQPCCSCRCLRQLVGSLAGSFSWTCLLLDDEPPDLAMPVTAETYMETRLLPLKMFHTEMMQQLRRLRVALHLALVLFFLVSLMFAAVGAPSLIPIALSLAAFTSSVMHWIAPAEAFMALDGAIETLNALDRRWRSTDVVENRSLATKVHLIVMTERIALRVARSFSPATLLPELAEGDDDESEVEAGDEKATEASIMEQRSRPISISVAPSQEQSAISTPSIPDAGGRGVGAAAGKR